MVYLKVKFGSVEELRKLLDEIYKLKERGLSLKRIAEELGVHKGFVYNVLRYGSVEEAFKRYSKYVKDVNEGEIEKSEDVKEGRIEKTAEKAIVKEVVRYAANLSVQQLRRLLEQGMLVDEYAEKLRERQIERYKRIAAREMLMREILDEAFVYYLLGKIDKEKLARIVVATYML